MVVATYIFDFVPVKTIPVVATKTVNTAIMAITLEIDFPIMD